MKITKKYKEKKKKVSIENYLKKNIYIKREYGRNRYRNMSEERNKN